MRRLLFALLVLILVVSAALFFWVRAVFTQDAVRTALAAQLSSALGQPVSIGGISATIYPRVTVQLRTVSIGDPVGVQIDALDVGTDFRALLSRRIEHATAHLKGASVQLPLLSLRLATGGTPAAGSVAAPPVELVSIDEIVLSDVEITGAGRTLRGDMELVPEADGVITVRRASLSAEDTMLEAAGRISDLNGPAGELTVTAHTLNLDRLLAFLTDFAGAATAAPSDTATAATTSSGAGADLNVAITAGRARLAGISLDTLSARAHVTEKGIELQPLAFATFGGTYDGSIMFQTAPAGSEPSFVVKGAAEHIDLPAVTRFAGTEADPITGRLSARLDLTGTGAEMADAMRTMRGTARVVVENGIVRNLGLVRAIVIATSMRGTAATVEGAGAAATEEAAKSRDEPFKTLSATLAVAGQRATTDDLQLAGTDVTMTARGSIALLGTDVNLSGRVQLSDELTAQAGTDLVRLTQEGGRVTLPVSVTGPADALSVHIDIADVLKRGLRNRAEEELKKSILKGLGGLIKKPPM